MTQGYMSLSRTYQFTVSLPSGRKVQLKVNATSCPFADGNLLFYMNTSDSGPIENHTEHVKAQNQRSLKQKLSARPCPVLPACRGGMRMMLAIFDLIVFGR